MIFIKKVKAFIYTENKQISKNISTLSTEKEIKITSSFYYILI